MSRTASFFTALVVSLGLLGVSLIVDATWLTALAIGALGFTSLVYARELGEQGPGFSGWWLPSDPHKRVIVLRVFGAILLALGVLVLVGTLV